MPSPARRLALTTLGQVHRKRGTLADALAAREIEQLDPRERAFVHELVLGTLRRRGWVDYVLRRLSARPLACARPPIRDVLRLGAYQLLFLRVPPHAAVSEAVDLARAVDPRGGSDRYVNAVLRRLEREGPPPEPDPEVDALGWLTTAGSLPPWLAERWLECEGPVEVVARARAFLDPPRAFFRFNPRREGRAEAEAAGLSFRPSGVPGAWWATDGPVSALAARGVLYLQDLGSQLVAHLAASPGVVLDACAAPGGKALLLADEVEPAGRVVACEVASRRLGTLVALTRRWGAPNVLVVGADSLHPPFGRQFDSVLLDAPCSGLGTLARHPDIRWRLGPGDVERHARRQRALLEAVASLVRRGGRLVYATCSIEEEENEAVVLPFLDEHPEFSIETGPSWAASFAHGPFFRTDPSRQGGDAFFAARLVRAER
jgi:16S rRNA (cytosine967-C5)-methyltransferase